MAKQLLIIGDSFCHGIGTASTVKHPDNLKFAFGKHLAEYFNLEYVNLAEPGISILRTVELGYEYLKHNHDQVERVIIGWTNPNRIGLYAGQSSLQILPSFVWLGDTGSDDIFVEYENGVKFGADKNNKDNLSPLPALHKLVVENDLFNQTSLSTMAMDLFKVWLEKYSIPYYDFSVFGQIADVKLSTSFNAIMPVNRHPTIDEQKLFADLLIKELTKNENLS